MKKGLLALFIMMLGHATCGGELDNFEKKAIENNSKNQAEQDDNKKANKDKTVGEELREDVGNALFDAFFDVVLPSAGQLMMNGGQSSWLKAQSFGGGKSFNGPIFSVSPKSSGDRLVPFARFDFYGSEVSSDVYLKDYTLELGYGPLALSMKESNFKEKGADDKLKLRQTFLDYRLLASNEAQVNLGLGRYLLQGNKKTSQMAVKFGFIIGFFSDLYLDYHYIRSHGTDFSITDHEASFTYTFKNIGLKAGYRKVDTTGAELTGPFAGFTLQF